MDSCLRKLALGMLAALAFACLCSCGKTKAPAAGTTKESKPAPVKATETKPAGQPPAPAPAPAPPEMAKPAATSTEEPAPPPKPKAVKPGPARDWKEIAQSGKLRVLVMPRSEPNGLARRMMPEDYERALLANLKQQFKIELELIPVGDFVELFSSLLEGNGDMIAASITITPERRKLFAFTTPFFHTTEQIVVSSKEKDVKTVADLVGKTGCLQPGTCYWESMEGLLKQYPGIKLAAAPPGLEPESLLLRVGARKYQFTVADDNYVENYLAYRQDVKSIYEFPGRRDLAWPVRKESKELLAKLNAFISEELPHTRNKDAKGDMPEIKRRKFLRVLTRNNPYCYFIHRGRPMGFEHDLASEFAKRSGVNAVMVTPPEWNDMIPWLMSGKGDVIASTFTMTPARKANKGIAFCRPYGSVTQTLVGRSREKAISSLQDLKGRTVVVRKSSSYWETMSKLRDSGLGFKLLAAPEDMETHEIISKVAAGEFDLTVADDIIANAESSAEAGAKSLIAVSEPEGYAWAVRAEDYQLRAEIDRFFKEEYKSTFYNLTYKKYFRNAEMASSIDRDSLQGLEFGVSPYDEIFKKYGSKFGFHWCLIAAQSYQESRFDPKAKSHLGTLGLLQLLPSTAAEMGFRDVVSPDSGVHAGVKYLSKQRDRIPKGEVDDQNRVCFALACYNAGYGHLYDARNLAEELGLSPNVWPANVEEAMKRLSEPRYASKARYGYCKSSETLNYVREIMVRYKHYSDRADAKTRREAVGGAPK